ncbi:MAG: hypothetical protein J6U04_02705 [Salinivirgaceae bacterium]|nr:hypothetical protein [Salinivirgaceae bacterium]
MKKLFIVSIPMLLAVTSHAQLSPSENQLVAKSVKESLLVVQQSYKVKDRNADLYYGFNGKNEFGHTNSVAIMLKDGLCYTSAFLRPWDGNVNYRRYETEYLPLYIGAQFKYVTDSTFREFQFDSVGGKRTESDFVYVKNNTPFDTQGLELDTIASRKQGWLLWVVSDDTIHPTDSLTIDVRACNVTVSDTTIYHKVNQPTRALIFSTKTYTNVLGGIFVTPQYTAVGEVRFLLTGVLVKKNSEWQLTTPFLTQERQSSTTITNAELTPIQIQSSSKKGKNKKN